MLIMSENGLRLYVPALGDVAPPVLDLACSELSVSRLMSLISRAHQKLRDEQLDSVAANRLEQLIANYADNLKRCLDSFDPPFSDALRAAAQRIVQASGWGHDELTASARRVLENRPAPGKEGATQVINWIKENWIILAVAAAALLLFGVKRR